MKKTKTQAEYIVDAICSCLPTTDDKSKSFGLHEPWFVGKEKEYVLDCIDTGWVSSVGSYVDKFEQRLAEITGTKFAVACVNGTAALQVCLLICGVQKGDEVLVPTLTFAATANAVVHAGAIPHFVDSEETTLGIDSDKLAHYLEVHTEIINGQCINKNSGNVIRALVVMHTFGHPVDLDKVSQVCSHFKLELVEDAAEALGTLYKNKHVCSHGRVSALSFNGNKIITTGGGGAIVTNSAELAARAKHLTTTAKLPHPWEFFHDETGFNFRMPNLNAALGLAQIENLNLFLQNKRLLAEKYQAVFKNIEGIEFVQEPEFAKSNFWLSAIKIHDCQSVTLVQILEEAHKRKIGMRPLWNLMHTLPMYEANPRMSLDCAEKLRCQVLALPSSASLRV